MNLLLFLGGTCNGSVWREDLIPLLEYEKIPYFNPVVDHWDGYAPPKQGPLQQAVDATPANPQ